MKFRATHAPEQAKRIAVYTAIFGGRDTIREPTVRPQDIDYFCFTDNPELKSAVWNIVYEKPRFTDPVRAAKVYKLFPQEFFPEYDLSIWVDGNLLIQGDLTELAQRALVGADFAAYDHNQLTPDATDCIYEEAEDLYRAMENGRYQTLSKLEIETQIKRYRQEQYPAHYGLIAGAVLVRRHHSPECVLAMQTWWDEIASGSRRDELSFNYVVWKTGFHFNYIPGDVRNNEYFKMYPHEKRT